MHAQAQPVAVATPDLDDLEALFDQVVAEREVSLAVVTPAEAGAQVDVTPVCVPDDGQPYDVFQRVGAITRKLHDALRELGYDKAVEEAVGSLPDARSRLDYIAKLTEDAANRVLAATEKGAVLNDAFDVRAKALSQRWDVLMAGKLSVADFKALALESREFIAQAPKHGGENRALFTEIMMAQDFQDLTGQVIQRVVKIAQTLEEQLLKLLLEATPPERRHATEGFLTGPAIDAANREDVVQGQAQVDDLLESLGF